MMGLRNLYKVFRETRNAAREQATLAVTGDSPRASEVAALLGAQRNMRGAEIILSVSEKGATISGKAVEDPGKISLPSTYGKALIDELAPRIVRVMDEDYLVPRLPRDTPRSGGQSARRSYATTPARTP